MRQVKTFVLVKQTVKFEPNALKGVSLPSSTSWRYTDLDIRLRKYHNQGFKIFEKSDGIKCEKIENGVSQRWAAVASGIDESTFYDWMKTKPQFSKRVSISKGIGIAKMVGDLASSNSHNAKMWLLERWAPEEFHLRSQVNENILLQAKELKEMMVHVKKLYANEQGN